MMYQRRNRLGFRVLYDICRPSQLLRPEAGSLNPGWHGDPQVDVGDDQLYCMTEDMHTHIVSVLYHDLGPTLMVKAFTR
jgi:hypothetical protein